MSGYNLQEKQKPFKPHFDTSVFLLEPIFKAKDMELTGFKVTMKIGKKGSKIFRVKKADILTTFKEVEKYLNNQLKNNPKKVLKINPKKSP